MYAIAKYLSEDARKAAVEAKYEVYFGNLRSVPDLCCPMGIALQHMYTARTQYEGHNDLTGVALRQYKYDDRDNMLRRCPTSADVTMVLRNHGIRYDDVRTAAGEFINAWDGNGIDDLYEALGVERP